MLALSTKIGDSQKISGLKAAQTAHWQALFSGAFDAEYIERVTRIGRTHNCIGLELRWCMAGYSFALAEITKILAQRFRKKTGRFEAAVTAVSKALFLDMDFAIPVYFDAMREDARMTLDGHATSFENTIQGLMENLASASTEMQATAESMTENAEQSLAKGSEVSAAALLANASVGIVASAAKEMAASLKDVSE